MYDGQSTGFGISAGDQQYVNGIFNASASPVPAILGTGSRFSDFFLHKLITSDKLQWQLVHSFGSLEIHSPLPSHHID